MTASRRRTGPGAGGIRDPADIEASRRVLAHLARLAAASDGRIVPQPGLQAPLPRWLIDHCESLLDRIRKGR